MTWLAAVGQKANAGGERVLRGEASMSIATWPRGLTRRRRASRRATGVTWLAALGQKADRRRARAVRRSASMPLATGPAVVGRWADVAAGAGYETSRLFGPFWRGPGPDLSPAVGAVRPVVLGRYGRRGEALPWHLAR